MSVSPPLEPQETTALVRVRALSKAYAGHTVVDTVSLSVNQGEVVCIVGASGSGKTTLLRCVAMLETPDAGEIWLQDQCIAAAVPTRTIQAARRQVRAEIGMVFQHFNLWPHFTVLENIIEAPMRVRRTPRRQAVDQAMVLLDKVGLRDKRDSYPQRLSGGQQQRVAIARALAMQPRVMLFDEATSALDPELRREVLGVMRQLAAEGMTMLVVTHEMAFAREAASRVVFMDAGRIVEIAPPAQFFQAPSSMRARQFLRQLDG